MSSSFGNSFYKAILTCLSLLLLVTSSPYYPSAKIFAASPLLAPHFPGSGSGTLKGYASSRANTTPKELGICPLKHTDVTASISGYVSRVTVRQLFENPFKEKIEAVYTFPLSETAAVDEMLMKIGSRTIHGTIKRRQEARNLYETAKAQGHVASLLDQERTNIFTQYVANIEPGKQIEITLKYADLLPYESGSFTFAFPTVVGPRFIPGNVIGKQGIGRTPDTNLVPDASLITPQVAPKGERAGHDIAIAVNIEAGVPILDIQSRLHEVEINQSGNSQAKVALKDKATIPNKDFVLTWQVASDKLQSGYLTHKTGDSGYFTLMILPPKRVTPDVVAPKEMIFLIDCSGSQEGQPLAKAKETLNYIIDHMNPNDTFQIISFNNNVTLFAETPEQVSPAMKSRAKRFIDKLNANGGTWMAPAVEKACSIPADAHRLRIVTFMTDGYVGNDFEILGMVRKLRGNSRWFPFGTGNSVNRMLIDGIAGEGGGEAEYVLLNSPGHVVGKKFYDRISSPVLTDVKVDFQGLSVKEVFPHQISDVWAERPLYIKGRYLKPGTGIVTISGFASGKPYKQDLKVSFPERQPNNQVLGSLWARAKVDRLMSEDWFGAQQGSVNNELKEEIIRTALEHHIMTQYTSFVAIDESIVTKGGTPKTIAVPVEVPDGVSRERTIAEEGCFQAGGRTLAPACCPAPTPAAHLKAGAKGAGSGGLFGKSLEIPLPTPPSLAHNERASQDAASERKLKDKKLDLSLVKLENKIAKLGKNPQIPGLEIVNGKITVKISLTDTSATTIKQLKAKGVKIITISKDSILAKVATAKLEVLACLDVVKYIEPYKFSKQ